MISTVLPADQLVSDVALLEELTGRASTGGLSDPIRLYTSELLLDHRGSWPELRGYLTLSEYVRWRRILVRDGDQVPLMPPHIRVVMQSVGDLQHRGSLRTWLDWATQVYGRLRTRRRKDVQEILDLRQEVGAGETRTVIKPEHHSMMTLALAGFLGKNLRQVNQVSVVVHPASREMDRWTSLIAAFRAPGADLSFRLLPNQVSVAIPHMVAIPRGTRFKLRDPDKGLDGLLGCCTVDTMAVGYHAEIYGRLARWIAEGGVGAPQKGRPGWLAVVPGVVLAELASHVLWPPETTARATWNDYIEAIFAIRDIWPEGPLVIRDLDPVGIRTWLSWKWPVLEPGKAALSGNADALVLASCYSNGHVTALHSEEWDLRKVAGFFGVDFFPPLPLGVSGSVVKSNRPSLGHP